jgi:hypothetical protein
MQLDDPSGLQNPPRRPGLDNPVNPLGIDGIGLHDLDSPFTAKRQEAFDRRLLHILLLLQCNPDASIGNYPSDRPWTPQRVDRA